MRSLKIAGLCLASMLVMGMSLAGNASATAALWLVCLEGVGLTKYSNSECNKLETGGKWQSLGLLPTQSDTVRIKGFTLRLKDPTALGGSSEIECNGNGIATGLIENKGKGKIFAAKVEEAEKNCRRISGGCKVGEIKRVQGANTPWVTEAEETPSGKLKYLFVLKPTTVGKEPGWEVECNTLLGVKTDVCTTKVGEEEHAWGENVFTKEGTKETLLVLGEFAKTRKAHCEGTGASGNEGEVEGRFAILLAKGGPLSLNV